MYNVKQEIKKAHRDANKALRRVQLKTLINQVRAFLTRSKKCLKQGLKQTGRYAKKLYAITLKSVDRFNTYLTSSTRLKG